MMAVLYVKLALVFYGHHTAVESLTFVHFLEMVFQCFGNESGLAGHEVRHVHAPFGYVFPDPSYFILTPLRRRHFFGLCLGCGV